MLWYNFTILSIDLTDRVYSIGANDTLFGNLKQLRIHANNGSIIRGITQWSIPLLQTLCIISLHEDGWSDFLNRHVSQLRQLELAFESLSGSLAHNSLVKLTVPALTNFLLKSRNHEAWIEGIDAIVLCSLSLIGVRVIPLELEASFTRLMD